MKIAEGIDPDCITLFAGEGDFWGIAILRNGLELKAFLCVEGNENDVMLRG